MGGIIRNKEVMFVLFLRGRRAGFKARAKLVLRLRTANLLKGATLKESINIDDECVQKVHVLFFILRSVVGRVYSCFSCPHFPFFSFFPHLFPTVKKAISLPTPSHCVNWKVELSSCQSVSRLPCEQRFLQVGRFVA